MTIPNIITLLRIAFIPFLVLIFYLPFHGAHIASAAVFAAAAISDWIDGYLARKLQQTSKLGAFLDPVADKLLVAVALVLLVGEPGLPYLAIPAAIIVGREIVISALREWMAELGKRASVAVSMIGKLKTAMQMVSIILLLSFKPDISHQKIMWLGYGLLYIAAILTMWSMFVYIKAAWPELMTPDDSSLS